MYLYYLWTLKQIRVIRIGQVQAIIRLKPTQQKTGPKHRFARNATTGHHARGWRNESLSAVVITRLERLTPSEQLGAQVGASIR